MMFRLSIGIFLGASFGLACKSRGNACSSPSVPIVSCSVVTVHRCVGLFMNVDTCAGGKMEPGLFLSSSVTRGGLKPLVHGLNRRKGVKQAGSSARHNTRRRYHGSVPFPELLCTRAIHSRDLVQKRGVVPRTCEIAGKLSLSSIYLWILSRHDYELRYKYILYIDFILQTYFI